MLGRWVVRAPESFALSSPNSCVKKRSSCLQIRLLVDNAERFDQYGHTEQSCSRQRVASWHQEPSTNCQVGTDGAFCELKVETALVIARPQAIASDLPTGRSSLFFLGGGH